MNDFSYATDFVSPVGLMFRRFSKSFVGLIEGGSLVPSIVVELLGQMQDTDHFSLILLQSMVCRCNIEAAAAIRALECTRWVADILICNLTVTSEHPITRLRVW